MGPGSGVADGAGGVTQHERALLEAAVCVSAVHPNVVCVACGGVVVGRAHSSVLRLVRLCCGYGCGCGCGCGLMRPGIMHMRSWCVTNLQRATCHLLNAVCAPRLSLCLGRSPPITTTSCRSALWRCAAGCLLAGLMSFWPRATLLRSCL